MITKVINSKSLSLSPHQFKYCLSKDAARFDYELLKSFNGDIDAIVRWHPFSPMSYGSEFKDTSLDDEFRAILDEAENSSNSQVNATTNRNNIE